jgi:hypothetical protein
MDIESELVPAEEALQYQMELLGIERGEMEAALNLLISGFSLDDVAKGTKINRNNLIAAAKFQGIKLEIK